MTSWRWTSKGRLNERSWPPKHFTAFLWIASKRWNVLGGHTSYVQTVFEIAPYQGNLESREIGRNELEERYVLGKRNSSTLCYEGNQVYMPWSYFCRSIRQDWTTFFPKQDHSRTWCWYWDMKTCVKSSMKKYIISVLKE